jgi:3-isopropylmalate/(R)-2-methylmalate dehydratase small subunit
MLGIPCFAAEAATVGALQSLIEQAPETAIELSVDDCDIRAGSLHRPASLPSALRDSFLTGEWNPTALLLAKFNEVRAVAARLPYVNGFTRP